MIAWLTQFMLDCWFVLTALAGIVPELVRLVCLVVVHYYRMAVLNAVIARNVVAAFLIGSLAKWIKNVAAICGFLLGVPNGRRRRR